MVSGKGQCAGLSAADIKRDKRENDWGTGQAHARDGPECWAKECGLLQEKHGGGLKQEG